MRLLISAGEASGDAYGAALLREMRRLGLPAQVKVQALGGKRLAHEGADIIVDASDWGAIGVAQALRVAPRVLRGRGMVEQALRGEPGLFIPIDFGYVNVRLARTAKERGWKVLYFMPPGSWRRDRQGGDLPAVTDAISTPFEWSAKILNDAGATAHWFGHPIRQLIKESGVPQAETRSGVAILPGSRQHEIRMNLPIIAEALKDWPEPCEFGVAPTVDQEQLTSDWIRWSGRQGDVFTVNDLYGVLRRAHSAAVCSGTATLEAALCGCPMAVVYRISKGMRLEATIAGLKGKFISLPNILLQREAVPELADSTIDPQALLEHLNKLKEGKARQDQLEAFEELKILLGAEDAVTKTAELALSML